MPCPKYTPYSLELQVWNEILFSFSSIGTERYASTGEVRLTGFPRADKAPANRLLEISTFYLLVS